MLSVAGGIGRTGCGEVEGGVGAEVGGVRRSVRTDAVRVR